MMQLLANSGMTVQGWIFFGVSWGVILGVLLFCYTKILKKNGGKRRKNKK